MKYLSLFLLALSISVQPVHEAFASPERACAQEVSTYKLCKKNAILALKDFKVSCRADYKTATGVTKLITSHYSKKRKLETKFTKVSKQQIALHQKCNPTNYEVQGVQVQRCLEQEAVLSKKSEEILFAQDQLEVSASENLANLLSSKPLTIDGCKLKLDGIMLLVETREIDNQNLRDCRASARNN